MAARCLAAKADALVTCGADEVLPGQGSVDGRDSVVEACRSSAAEMDALAGHELVRLVSVASGSAAAVDAVVRCTDQEGSESSVSSADIYEFDAQHRVLVITSYAVEVGGVDPASAPIGDEEDRERTTR